MSTGSIRDNKKWEIFILLLFATLCAVIFYFLLSTGVPQKEPLLTTNVLYYSHLGKNLLKLSLLEEMQYLKPNKSTLCQHNMFRETKLQASRYYQSAIKLVPNDTQLSIKWGIIQAELGNKEKAKTIFEIAENEPEQKELVKILKEIYLQPLSPKTDIQSSVLILKQNLQGWFLHKTLITLYMKAGQKQEAQQQRKAATNEAWQLLITIIIFTVAFLSIFVLGIIVIIIFFLFKKRIFPSQSIYPKVRWSFLNVLFAFTIWLFLQLLAALILKTVTAGNIYQSFLIGGQGISILFGIYLLTCSSVLLIIYYYIRIKAKQSLQTIGLSIKRYRENILVGIAGYFTCLPLVTGATLIGKFIFRGGDFSSNPLLPIVMSNPSLIDKILLFIIVAIIAPIFEEIFFRGFTYRSLRNSFSPPYAILFTSLLFAFVHHDPFGFLPILTLGLIFSYVYERTGSLIPSILIHSLWNSSSFIATNIFFT